MIDNIQLMNELIACLERPANHYWDTFGSNAELKRPTQFNKTVLTFTVFNRTDGIICMITESGKESTKTPIADPNLLQDLQDRINRITGHNGKVRELC